MDAKAPRRHRVWLVAGVTIGLIVALTAIEMLAANSRLREEQSQLDVSSGKTRHVSKWFGIESEGPQEDTFLSDRLAGETIGGEPDWKPLTTHWGGLLIGTHGHSDWDRAWHSCRRLEHLWDEGGFSNAARTECVRRLLRAFKTTQGAAESLKFVDAIRDRVEALQAVPPSERHTTIEDLPAMDEVVD
jgi:hypothetical protein